MPDAEPYPLLLEPILMEKVWGGTRLARWGKPVAHGTRVGESWELADLSATSASGGGGGSARSRIANGPLAGRTLHDAIELWAESLLLKDRLTPAGDFPLLVKFLDARENLSVQVHPSHKYAAGHPGSHLKTECWLILEAQPGSVIYKGVKPGVTPKMFRSHIHDGTVADDLVRVPAVVGECHNLPSGTCHALGAGVLVAEVQTPSDTTFRVFDWGRVGRELHIEQAMRCITFGAAPRARSFPRDAAESSLAHTSHFTVDGVDLRSPIDAGHGVGIWIIIDGQARFTQPSGELTAPTGSTVVVPAACGASTRINADGHARAVRVRL
jgi:mannose-6-phosphate isomerase